MKKVFLDTNVVIDFYQRRQPFFAESQAIIQMAFDKQITLLVSATTIINAFYLLRKYYDADTLYDKMRSLFLLANVSDVTSEILAGALAEQWKDFEDCVQYLSATNIEADVIVTRNVKDYMSTSTPVLTPTEFLDRA